MRFLVTGSRHWDDVPAVETALGGYWFAMAHGRSNTVLVHGECTGLDTIAAQLWRRWNLPDEQFDADWDNLGKAAGPIRNQMMVASGADVCLAFPMPSSRGTFDCMRRAACAGIPVVNLGTAGHAGQWRR